MYTAVQVIDSVSLGVPNPFKEELVLWGPHTICKESLSTARKEREREKKTEREREREGERE